MATPTEIQRRLDELKKQYDDGRLSKDKYASEIQEYVRGLNKGDWERYAASDVYARQNTSSVGETVGAALAGTAAVPLTAGIASSTVPASAASSYLGRAGQAIAGSGDASLISSAARAGAGAARGAVGAARNHPLITAGIGSALVAGGLSGGGSDGPAAAAYTPTWTQYPLTQGFGPTSTTLDSAYGGYEHFNKGFDFGVPEGTPIDSVVAGTVISAGDAGDGWGTSVKVRDADGFVHNYGHLSSASVQTGQQIAAGDIIGVSGNTGKSTGPHLSYDVMSPDGKFVDPSAWAGGSPSQFASVQYANPTAQAAEHIGSVLEEWQAMKPRREDYMVTYSDGTQEFDAAGFAQAQQEWMTFGSSAMQLESDLRLMDAGIIAMPDGTYLGIEDALRSADPQIRDWAQQKQRDVQMGYAQVMDELNLGQFNAYNTATEAENSRLNTRFTQSMDRFNSAVDYDRVNVDRAIGEVNRMLEGQQESRERTDLITSALLEAAPWASGGKTDFYIGDLGSGVDTLARQAGIRPGQPLLSFPGTMRIDPQAMMTAEDVNRGVAGPLPLIPGLTADPSLIPSVPNTTPINTNVPQSALLPLLEQALRQTPTGPPLLPTQPTIDRILAGR